MDSMRGLKSCRASLVVAGKLSLRCLRADKVRLNEWVEYVHKII